MNEIIKNGLILMVYTAVAGLALGLVYASTKEAIEKADLSAKLEAMISVLQDPESGKLMIPRDEIEKEMMKEKEEKLIFESKEGKIYGPIYHFEVDGEEIYVVVGSSPGFGGDVKVMASFVKIDHDFYLNAIEVLDYSQETPGLGAKIGEKSIQKRFYPIPPEGLRNGVRVNKDAGVTSGDPDELKKKGIIMTSDVMTGATITPRAVANAINLMYRYLKEHAM